jgi:hypothetical protein
MRQKAAARDRTAELQGAILAPVRRLQHPRSGRAHDGGEPALRRTPLDDLLLPTRPTTRARGVEDSTMTPSRGRRTLTAVFLASSLPFLMVVLFPAQLDRVMDGGSYLVFHNVAEFFSIMVSLSLFGVGWYAYDQSQDLHALFLGTAFLAIGLIDFMHALSNAAMPVPARPGRRRQPRRS